MLGKGSFTDLSDFDGSIKEVIASELVLTIVLMITFIYHMVARPESLWASFGF